MLSNKVKVENSVKISTTFFETKYLENWAKTLVILLEKLLNNFSKDSKIKKKILKYF